MKKLKNAVILSAMLAASAAHAGPAADAMGQCFVDKTSAEDRLVLVQWIGTAIAAHPSAEPVLTVDASALGRLDSALGALFTRLMVEDCTDTIKAAIAAEGMAVFQQSGELLGRIAMQDIMTHPAVNARMEGFAAHIDEARLNETFR